MAEWLRRHALAIGVVTLGIATLAAFTWAEFRYFCDQQAQWNEVLRAAHGQPSPCPGFWSAEHLHDWVYNAASNWQSELLVGIGLLVALNKLEGPRGADREDT